jgi:site-specific recombinase XerD
LTGPLAAIGPPYARWVASQPWKESTSQHALRSFFRLSRWLAEERIELPDVDEGVLDVHTAAETARVANPAAVQYMPAIKRFFAERRSMVLRPSRPRDLGGVPRRTAGPLAGMMGDLVAHLAGAGYRTCTIKAITPAAARLSRCMEQRGVPAEGLDSRQVNQFAEDEAADGHPASARRVAAVRSYLAGRGLCPTALPTEEPPTPAGLELDRWTSWMAATRHPAPATIRENRRWAEDLVKTLTDAGGQVDWDRLNASLIGEYQTERGRGYSQRSRRHLASALRSLCAWAHATSRVTHPVAQAVVSPRRPGLGLPRTISAEAVGKLNKASDQTKPVGLRDRAIVTTLSRLGIRAGEAAALTLDDIDWRAGRVTVTGKGRRHTLPLPADVGDAIVSYLQGGRPAGAADRRVFTRSRPPFVGLTRQGVSDVVKRAARRADLGTIRAQRLRHTAATSVLNTGGSIAEASQLLGHASLETTAIYARLDLASLAVLVRPWPDASPEGSQP